MNRKITVSLAALMALPLWAAKPKAPAKAVVNTSDFYVYRDKGDRLNHYMPTGWMGDYGDIKLNDADMKSPKDGKTNIQITYTAEAKQGANWTGMYWQHPSNNWGTKDGGFDLSAYKKLTFWAKGVRKDKKPVIISEFKIGGISGEFGDSDAASIGPIELTDQWKLFTIDLADKNLAHIIGGFCWAANKDNNPTGFTLFLDEIRYEK